MANRGWRDGSDDAARLGRGLPRRYAELGDRALVDALRSRDGEAIEELMRRYQALAFVQAKRLRVPPEDRSHWVLELLYQVASAIARTPTSVPRSLGPYIVTACKRKAYTQRRDRLTREAREARCTEDTGALGLRAVLSACSESAVRSTYAPDWERARLPPVLERLVSVFEEGVSPEERQLLSWVGQRVPYSLIAEWLGISRGAAIKRVGRLRERLIEAAFRFGASLDATDVSELVRFLRRTGVVEETRLLELQGRTFRTRGL